MRSRLSYFLISVCLFLIEACIGLYVHDAFIRPYFGDFLIVMLIYGTVQVAGPFEVKKTVFWVFVFSVLIELAQLFQLRQKLGLEAPWTQLVLGSAFEWGDLLAYALGCLAVVLIEKIVKKRP